MEQLGIKKDLKNALLLSAGLFIVGRKKVDELSKRLEAAGINKAEAEKTALEVLDSAKKHKAAFLDKVSSELENKVNFASKEDVKTIKKLLHDIAKKLED